MQKDLWKSRNIFITTRFNGMSLRSFVYTKNKLSGKESNLGESSIVIGQSRHTFPYFINALTGNNLMYYGGSQKRLFKEDKYNWDATEIKLLEVKFKNAVKKHIKQYAGNIVGNNVLSVARYIRPKRVNAGSYKDNIEFVISQLSNELQYRVTVWNHYTQLPRRTIITREEKVSDKEKGDWKASFPVIKMGIEKIVIDIWDKERTPYAKVIFKDKKFISRLESNNFFKAESNVHGKFAHGTYPPVAHYEDSKQRSRAATPGLKHNWMARHEAFISGKISIEEFRQGGKIPEERKKQQEWKKILRRKQFPADAVFLLVEGKYTLYSPSILSAKFNIFGGMKE